MKEKRDKREIGKADKEKSEEPLLPSTVITQFPPFSYDSPHAYCLFYYFKIIINND